MSEHLIQHAAKWFEDKDAWESFVDLIPLKDGIEREWLVRATEDLRRHFREKPPLGWNFREWGNNHDTWWFLEEFGHESVGIGFGWRYHFCFGIAFPGRMDRERLNQLLQEERYAALRGAFGRIDQVRWNGLEFEQYGNFAFGSIRDHRLPAHELAWFAGFQRQDFVRQAAAKIEAFVEPGITALLRTLNSELLR